MKKSNLVLSVLFAVPLSLVGCGSSTPAKEAAAPVPDCVFPNTNVAAPGWICDEPVPGLAVSAVGVAEPTKAGIAFQKDIAAADARGQLAERMKVQVAKMVKKYLGTTGVGSEQTVDAAASSTLKTITSENLVSTRIYKTRTGPNGRLYVLVGMDPEAKAKTVQEAVSTSMKNDQALWQQFKAKQSFEEMAAEIAKQN